MASPDERFERWTLIEFLVAQNVKSIDILRRLLSVYGNVTQGSDISSVGRWALRTEGIEVGKAILSDHDRYRRSVTVTDDVHKQKFNDLVQENRRIKYDI